MNNNVKKLFFTFFLIVIFLSCFWSCRPKWLMPHEEVVVPETAEAVINKLRSKHVDYDWFSARFSGSAVYGGRNYSVAGSIRIKKDSAIYVSVAPVLGIEVVRMLLTPDTVKYVNRLESSYYVGDTQFLSSLVGANIDFYMLQSLITGNDFSHFETKNFVMTNERNFIKMSNPSRRNNLQSHVSLSQQLLLDSENYRITQNIISDHRERVVSANYRSWEDIEGQLFPSSLQLIFSDKNTRAELLLSFSRMGINTPQNMSFRIPPRYERINY